MQATSPSTIAMDLEDFRRLGVRPYETRLTVIRLAALRSAKALAEQQLDNPSEQVGVQLSRVATSTYRLLDPRQREDAIQRAHVGRILPNTLNWDGHTRFHDSSVKASVETAFHRDSLSDVELIAMLDLDGPPRYEDEVQGWTASLSDEDLLHRASRRAALERFGRYLRTPWITGAVAGMVFGLVLALVTVARSKPDPIPRFASAAPTADTALAELPSPETAEPNIEPAAGGLESELMLDPLAQTAAAPAEARSAHDLLQPTQADLAPIPPLTAWLDPSEQEAEKDRSATPARSLEPNAERNGRSKRTVLTIPSKAQRLAARRHLKSILPQLQQTPLPSQVASRIEQIEVLRESLEIDSPDRWAAQMMIAELAWLVEDGRQVNERLKWFTEQYDVSRSDLLAQSFVAACQWASLPETHQHLLDQGLVMADRLLVHESLEACRRVLEAVAPSAEILESESSRQEIEDLSEAVAQATRLAQASRRWLDESGAPVPGSDIGVLGRYYALMLRRWDIGLPWLSEVSSSRIANVARQELELRRGPAADATIEVGRLWLSVADRSGGRVADSIRLHAIDLMKDTISQTSGLKKLELERAIERAQEQLPSYLRRRSSGLQIPAPAQAPRV